MSEANEVSNDERREFIDESVGELYALSRAINRALNTVDMDLMWSESVEYVPDEHRLEDAAEKFRDAERLARMAVSILDRLRHDTAAPQAAS